MTNVFVCTVWCMSRTYLFIFFLMISSASFASFFFVLFLHLLRFKRAVIEILYININIMYNKFGNVFFSFSSLSFFLVGASSSEFEVENNAYVYGLFGTVSRRKFILYTALYDVESFFFTLYARRRENAGSTGSNGRRARFCASACHFFAFIFNFRGIYYTRIYGVFTYVSVCVYRNLCSFPPDGNFTICLSATAESFEAFKRMREHCRGESETVAE